MLHLYIAFGRIRVTTMFLCVCVSVCVHCQKAWLVVVCCFLKGGGAVGLVQLPFLGLAIFGLHILTYIEMSESLI